MFNMNLLRLYHLSTTDLGDFSSFYPRIPFNTMHREDEEKTRICVSEKIEGALHAISLCHEPYETIEGFKRYYVYMPINEKLKILSNSRIQGLVPDSAITKETWILNECIMKKVGVIDANDIKIFCNYAIKDRFNELIISSYLYLFDIKISYFIKEVQHFIKHDLFLDHNNLLKIGTADGGLLEINWSRC